MKGCMEAYSPEEELVRLLAKKQMTITTAESCTGGLIAGTIVNVAGASDVLNEGYVTYSNEAKQRLVHVKAETLERFGAVSEETAREMAAGAAKAAGSDVAISATGIAGPGGGTKEKPVGLVYIGCCVGEEIRVKECRFSGTPSRESAFRRWSTAFAVGSGNVTRENIVEENKEECVCRSDR